MDWMVWAGTAISLAGLAGLVWCILRVWRARKADLSDEELRDVVRGVVPINMGALFASVIGLMMVVLGIFLG
ncbi:hypothetical protein [Thalassococcus lentus]|uniref:Uncharacterized protein n=1 Tax=Thalassococcus lentus TaxID=1210524 RepID=A0ABT4XUI2_9RHOB|nr:hypothetical protein [Thalassococcus lentus]MDA7425581.1 hypothetical protein [Thalassococcus lentus]